MTKAAGAELARGACDVAAFVVPAVAFVLCASHEPGSWDTAELQGVPYIMGITHPTGFPLYVLLGYAWTHLFALGTIAFRANVMSGVAVAGACATAYALARELGARRPVALGATLWFAFVQMIWAHAVRAEAQDLALLCEALATLCFVRWMKSGDGRWYAGAFALAGLGMSAHPNAIWLLPAFAIGSAIALRRPGWKLVAGSLALTVLGLSLYLYLPLRSAYVVAHGLDPTMGLVGTDGGIFWNYHDPSTPHGLALDLTGGDYGASHDLLRSLDPVRAQTVLWTLIVDIGTQFGAYALVVAAAGLVALWRRDWRTSLFVLLACAASLTFAVTYTNESDLGRYRMLGLLLAVPTLAAAVPAAARGPRAALARIALALFLFGGAAFAVYGNRSFFHRAPDEGGRWVIDAVKPYVPPGSIVVADWLDATSLAYGAYDDGSLAGRIVVSGSPQLQAPYYPVWARSRPVYLLVDPHRVDDLPRAKLVETLDAYHALWRALPQPR